MLKIVRGKYEGVGSFFVRYDDDIFDRPRQVRQRFLRQDFRDEISQLDKLMWGQNDYGYRRR